jgi:manganese-dependent inorganic pyrophosphatase
VNEGSTVLFAGDNGELISKAFGVQTNENSVYLQGVVSRKKQVVPLLANTMCF